MPVRHARRQTLTQWDIADLVRATRAFVEPVLFNNIARTVAGERPGEQRVIVEEMRTWWQRGEAACVQTASNGGSKKSEDVCAVVWEYADWLEAMARAMVDEIHHPS